MQLVLRGHYAGRTCELYGTQFINGHATIRDDQGNLARVLRRDYQALPDHEPDPIYEGEGGDQVGVGNVQTRAKNGNGTNSAVRSDLRQVGQESNKVSPTKGKGTNGAGGGNSGLATNGGGQENAGDAAAMIRSAVMSMDPEDDAHWTAEGLPQTKIVAGILGLPAVSRTELLRAGPGHNREHVRKTNDDGLHS